MYLTSTRERFISRYLSNGRSHFRGVPVEEGYVFDGWCSIPVLQNKLVLSKTPLFNSLLLSLGSNKQYFALISPYMLEQARVAAISRTKIVHMQQSLVESTSPILRVRFRRIPCRKEPAAHEYDKWPKFIARRCVRAERLTYVIHYQTFYSFFFKHYKAVYLTNNLWNRYKSFSASTATARSLWIGDVWYENKPLYMFQPLANLGPMSAIFHFFVKSMWLLWSYDSSPGVDRYVRTWKVYWYLRKAWQLEVRSKRRVFKGRRVRVGSLRFRKCITDRYIEDAVAACYQENTLNELLDTSVLDVFKTTAINKNNLLQNQSVLFSYLIKDNMPQLFQYGNIARYRTLCLYLTICDEHLVLLSTLEEMSLFRSIAVVYAFVKYTTFIYCISNRQRHPRWDNPFLSSCYKFTGDNVRRRQKKVIFRLTDPYWIHTFYANGRSPFNLFARKNKLLKHSFMYRLRHTHHDIGRPLNYNKVGHSYDLLY